MSHKRKTEDTRRNLVAKHARTFNLAHTFVDRKAKAKKGHIKHKGAQNNEQ